MGAMKKICHLCETEKKFVFQGIVGVVQQNCTCGNMCHQMIPHRNPIEMKKGGDSVRNCRFERKKI